MDRILFGEFIHGDVPDYPAIRNFAEERLRSWFDSQEIQQYVRGVSYRIVLESNGSASSFICFALVRSKAMTWEAKSFGESPFQAISRAFGSMKVSSCSLVRVA